MSILALPALKIARIEWGQRRFDLRFDNEETGAGQTRILAPPRWTLALIGPQFLHVAEAAMWRDLILRLQGRIHQLAAYDLGNPAPRGTMRGTLTLTSGLAVGATTLPITGGAGQAGTTILAGDWLGIGSGSTRQLVAAAADVTADGSGNASVPISQSARWAQISGSSVVWDKPTALFRQTTSESSWSHEGAIRTGYSLDLIESWE